MKDEIILHHDGHGLNESIHVYAVDELGPGGAHHEYEITVEAIVDGLTKDVLVGKVQFQRGPRNVEGSTPGCTELSLMGILIDRLQDFQTGPYACVENEVCLATLREAMRWAKLRADNRAARNVLGTYKV